MVFTGTSAPCSCENAAGQRVDLRGTLGADVLQGGGLVIIGVRQQLAVQLLPVVRRRGPVGAVTSAGHDGVDLVNGGVDDGAGV